MTDTILIQNYTYDLPADKIAAHPLANRDESKLLVYNKGKIQHATFKSVVDFLPSNSFLVFNDTRVIPARIHFQKETGAEIEIFLLSPQKPSTIMADAMLANKICTWQCTIGNLKRWKDDQSLIKVVNEISLHAKLIDRTEGIVEFTWATGQSFAEIISIMGLTPLPPYIKRDVSSEDVNRYQTIYSHYEGAVAAPTAGLHFTEKIMKSLEQKGIKKDFLTLHVSAGTFQPVKTDNALEHTMHHEQVVISKKTIENLISPNQFTVAVGTTSMRTLESLYWYGVQLLENPASNFLITQHDPYVKRKLPLRNEALEAISSYMQQ
ncbi:MAG TPA: S-adenosylmethionine:tRNA ribosyltransferase-isomerase, partial [Cyclobacteriaceae bacterium]|nr:S-adenosylmethionine:tRNA ribosyltransferase-isomerase [Cyclobacteriaceae bacterium]